MSYLVIDIKYRLEMVRNHFIENRCKKTYTEMLNNINNYFSFYHKTNTRSTR